MPDPRDIHNGWEIPSEGYCDQPYVVEMHDGAWLCVMTTGRGEEGRAGQHIVAIRSGDHGRSWTEAVDIEPADGPEASWVMPLIVPSGRVYAFYTYNADNLREVVDERGYNINRVDTLGHYCFKYSDDHGRSWSARHTIPIRATDIDRRNPYGGKVRLFWGVGKPILDRGEMFFGFAKVGRFGEGFMAESESWFIRSPNIATEPEPAKIQFDLLPDGDFGLKSPEGLIAEEANLVALSDGSLFCTYRTVAGSPCHAYSRDRGRTWTPPAFMTYYPGGPRVAHPRAANFVRKLRDGRFIYWFHNHNGRGYEGRNPAWLLGGVERDSADGRVIYWGRPQVVLYDVDRDTRMSYPDFIDEGDKLYVTETQKTIARVHEVDPAVLETLWRD